MIGTELSMLYSCLACHMHKYMCMTEGLLELMDIFPAANAGLHTNLQRTSTSFAGGARMEFQNLLHACTKKRVTTEGVRQSLEFSLEFCLRNPKGNCALERCDLEREVIPS